MKQIWAPWRKAYVTAKVRSKGCLFCRAKRAAQSQDQKNLVVHRSHRSFSILNLYPYNNGHVMVVPVRHVSGLEKLGSEERLDLLREVDLVLKLLRKVFHPEGFNLGLNLGRSGGAGVPGHVHLHMVPRWLGDTNFMPVLTGTKVISDSLKATHLALRRALGKKERRRR